MWRIHDCGIHVHVGLPDEGQWGDYYCRIINMMGSMMNRYSSRDFIWELSGRGDADDSHYTCQGEALCWDRHGGHWHLGDYEENEMLRENNPSGGSKTIENRMFSGQSGVLLNALEFTHSVFKFCLDNKKKVDYYPYLYEWAEWLEKQSGYRNLKQTAPFHLIGA